MKPWMKRSLIVLVLAIPGLAFAATKLAESPPAAKSCCPIPCDDCPFSSLLKQ
jgi:hypothetical protein